MSPPSQPTERFAQPSRLAELVTALGFRRYRLFLTGLLYQEPGGPLRRATAVASRDGDLVAYHAGEVVQHPGRVPTSRLFDDDLTGRSPRPWWTPSPTTTRHSSPTRWPPGPGPTQHQRDRHPAAAPRVPAPALCAAGHHRLRSPRGGPLEVTDALLDTFRRLADRHQRGFLAEQVLELLATS